MTSELWILSSTEPVENDEIEKGLTEPLLLSGEKQHPDEDDDKDCEDNEEALEQSHKPAASIASAYRLLTPSVKV